MSIRINKFIASSSAYSRRKVDELIDAGKVFVNGKQLKDKGVQIDPQKDKIKVNQQIIKTNSKQYYFALNKPSGYLTTRNDELGRKTVMELLPKIDNLKPIGRLDKDTEGLLLISNDGEFINSVTHPSYQCEKEYQATIKGLLSNNEIHKLEKGIRIDGKKTAPASVCDIKNDNTKNPPLTTLKITIHEGRNRQIRKMFASLGHNVKYLSRLRIGNINLGDLAKGKYRKLTNQEINAHKHN